MQQRSNWNCGHETQPPLKFEIHRNLRSNIAFIIHCSNACATQPKPLYLSWFKISIRILYYIMCKNIQYFPLSFSFTLIPFPVCDPLRISRELIFGIAQGKLLQEGILKSRECIIHNWFTHWFSYANRQKNHYRHGLCGNCGWRYNHNLTKTHICGKIWQRFWHFTLRLVRVSYSMYPPKTEKRFIL